MSIIFHFCILNLRTILDLPAIFRIGCLLFARWDMIHAWSRHSLPFSFRSQKSKRSSPTWIQIIYSIRPTNSQAFTNPSYQLHYQTVIPAFPPCVHLQITCRQILQSISCNRQRSRARHISQNEQVQSARLDRRTGLFPIRGPSDSSLNGGIWTALYEGPLTIYLRITHTPLEHQGYGFENLPTATFTRDLPSFAFALWPKSWDFSNPT